MAACQSYRERFTWRHDSVLNFLAQTLQSIHTCKLYVDISGFKSPSIITGNINRPDLLIIAPDESLYVVELTVGFETNLRNNVQRKHAKYKDLIEDLNKQFKTVKFINISINSLGVLDKECSTLYTMLNTLGLDIKDQQYCTRKMISIAIRSTYYIFCCRNKEWTNPKFLSF